MRRVLIRYRVKPGQDEANEALVRAVYQELRSSQPPGFRYATFTLGDGLSFVHLASVENPDGHNPLPDLGTFQAFQERIGERCEAPPEVTDLTEIGSYRMFGE